MRGLMAGAIVLAAGLLAGAPAKAQSVPPFKGNDTGGIAAYHVFPPQEIRALAAQHCASWGKVAIITGVQARYGGYVSFACRWQRVASRRGQIISVLN